MKHKDVLRGGLGLSLVVPLLLITSGSGTAASELVGQPALTVSAQPSANTVVVATAGSVQPTKYELENLTLIAESEGIPLDEAIQRYGWQEQFAASVASIREKYPDAFAGSSMNDGFIGGTVNFVGAVPPKADQLVTNIPVDVHLVGGSPYTRSQIDASVAAAHYDLYSESKPASVSTYYDNDAGTVVATLYSDDNKDSAESAALERSMHTAVQRVPTTGGEIPVVFKVAPAGGTGNDIIRGGALLGGSSSSSFACTSGWAVDSTSDSRKGLVTADHCPNSMSYSGRFVLTYRRSVDKNAGDVQFMSSTESVGKEFYYGVGDYRTVMKRGDPVNGQRLCKFGRNTGNTCDSIRDLFSCRDLYCNLVSMENREAGPGDSGGPWYYGTTAYGVHSGYHTTFPFQKHDQWSPLNSTLANLDTKLRIG